MSAPTSTARSSRVLGHDRFVAVDRDFNRLAEEREAVLAEISARSVTGVQAGQLRELHAKAESLARAMVGVGMRRERVRLELSTDVLANDVSWHKTVAEAKSRLAAAAEAWRAVLAAKRELSVRDGVPAHAFDDGHDDVSRYLELALQSMSAAE